MRRREERLQQHGQLLQRPPLAAAVGGREGEPHLECRELLGEEGRERRGGHRGGTQLCEDEGERLLGSQLPRVPKGVVLRRRQRRVRESGRRLARARTRWARRKFRQSEATRTS